MTNVPLLIEPVWNRNYDGTFAGYQAKGLLIEPVWNRNAIPVHRTLLSHRALLIEPVWNRNPSLSDSEAVGMPLLIEPVWNRNNVVLRCENQVEFDF